MGKLVYLFILVGCATSGNQTDVELDVGMRNALFKTQEYYESIKNINEPLFKAVKVDKCLVDWEQEVFRLKEKIKRTGDTKGRVEIWYQLGNCYNYVDEYKLSFYYYDLVLAEQKKNYKRKSIISYNLGQIYQKRGYTVLAQSYYEDAVKNNRSNNLALLNLALILTSQGEYTQSNSKINTLLRNSPNSQLARFVMGINYFYLKDYKSLNTKVLRKLVDKSTEKGLILIAKDLATGKNLKGAYEDLKDMDLEFPLHKSFRALLIDWYGKSINEKT